MRQKHTLLPLSRKCVRIWKAVLKIINLFDCSSYKSPPRAPYVIQPIFFSFFLKQSLKEALPIKLIEYFLHSFPNFLSITEIEVGEYAIWCTL